MTALRRISDWSTESAARLWSNMIIGANCRGSAADAHYYDIHFALLLSATLRRYSRCSLLRPTLHAQNARASATSSAVRTAEAPADASPPTAEAPPPLQLSARTNKIRISTSKTNVGEYVIDKFYFCASEYGLVSRSGIRQRTERRRARTAHLQKEFLFYDLSLLREKKYPYSFRDVIWEVTEV